MESTSNKITKKLSKSEHGSNNEEDNNKNFLLACKTGNHSLMKKFRSHISSINVKEKETGNTALHLACINGHEKIAQALIKLGINIDEKNSEGFVALYYAIYNGLVATVKILLDHESYMECLDKYGNSILHISCELGYIEIVKYLLEKKVLNNQKNKNFKTPIHIASQKGFVDIIQLMLQRHDILIDDIDSNGKTALIMACENDHLNIVKLLLRSNSNIYIRDNKGKSAIFYACQVNNTEMIKALINANVDIMQYDNDTVYPLHLACMNGNLEIVKMFVETLNADVECRDKNGYTPLYVAYINQRSNIIKYLIGKGCNVDAQNNDGVAILHYCCMIDCMDSLKNNNSNPENDATIMAIKKRRREKLSDSRSSSRSYLLDDTLYCSIEELSNFAKSASIDKNGKKGLGSTSSLKREKSMEQKKSLKSTASRISIKRLLSKSSGKLDKTQTEKTEYDINKENNIKNKKKIKSEFLANENINIHKIQNSNVTNEEEELKKGKSIHFGFNRKGKGDGNNESTKKSTKKEGKNEIANTKTEVQINESAAAKKSVSKSLSNIKKNKVNDSRSNINSLPKGGHMNSNEFLASSNNLYFINEMEFIEILLDNNVDINIRDNDGNTPLMIACAFRRTEQINLLLKRGAHTDVLNNEGISPLDFLCFDKELGIRKEEINIYNSSRHENYVPYLVQKDTFLSNTSNKTYKYTPLHLACYNNNLDMIRFLLEKGLNINASDCNLNTPFHILCKKGYSAILKELFEMKLDINVNAQNVIGKTGMHYACQNQDVVTIKLLLEHNVNLGLVDSHGNNPLHIACSVNNHEIIDLILNHILSEYCNEPNEPNESQLEQQPNIKKEPINNEMEIINCFNNNHETPIFLALQNGDIKIVNRLLHLHNINISFEDKENENTLLHLACEKEIVSVAQNLLWLSVDPNIQNKHGNTPLHIACQKSSLDLINVLLNFKNLDVNIKNNDLETPIHIACNNKSEDLCLFLLDRKAKLDIEDNSGHTAFFIACKQGLTKVVKKMLKSGIDVHRLDKNGYTALHIACAYERVQITKLLLEYNADVNIQNPNNNISPYDIIIESQNKNLINLIDNKKEVKLKRPTSALNPKNANKSFNDYKSEALNFMFSSGAMSTPKLRNSRSDTRLKKYIETNDNDNVEEASSPLHRACEKGMELKVKVLLDYGDDINLIDNFDNTPLHYACTYNRINIAKILLQNPKINIDIKCCQSRITPFLCAAYNKNKDMMDILLEHGANINACDSNGASALFNLCKENSTDVYKYLIDHHINAKIQDKSGMTVLHQIAISHETDLAELIINYDPSIIDYQDIYGKTALHYCAMNNYKDIMKILIENKASIKIKDKKHKTVVDYLTEEGYYTEELKQLIKSVEHSELKDFNLHSCQLIKACKRGDYKLVKYCLKKLGNNIYYVDESGRIALHYACENGNIKIVKLLLERGSCINVYDNKFFTPLYLASFNGYYDISKLLLERGASSNNIDFKTFKKIERLQENSDKNVSSSMEKFSDIEEYMKFQTKGISVAEGKDKKQKVEDKSYLRLSSTPLISAILNGQNDIVEVLINNGTNINEKDEQDLNPFYYACSINNEGAIRLLIEKKVEIENYCDPLKTSIMHFACKYGNVELAERIMDCYAMFLGNISQSSIYISRSHSRELSFERYCGVNEYNRANMFGVTPFHWACLYGRRNIIKLFKNAGVEIFLDKDIAGNTALHHVCNSGNTESVRLVLKYIRIYNTDVQKEDSSYININGLNGDGDSALHIAVKKGNEDVIKLLIDNGIDKNVLNSNNQTAKQYAESIKLHNKQILELLD